jgi:ribonuclease R
MASDGRNIREQILGLLARKDYRPLDKTDIARKIGLTGAGQVALRKSLRELERTGEIARIRKNRYVLPAEADLVTGKLSIHQVGYGFLAP